MARAVDQHTPIEWTLPDLLEYLTLAPFGYNINRALREMSQAIATGKLPLKRVYYVDGKFHTDWLDPFRFRLHYTLELDRVTAVVRVVKRGWLPGEASFHYTVVEQDVLDLWPSRPPASQTAPDQQPRRLTKVAKPDSRTADRDAAIKNRLANGGRPGSNVVWKKWCDAIRTDCDAVVVDVKKRKFERGFSDDYIEEVTRKFMKPSTRQA